MRDYQKECVEVIENTFKTRQRQLIQLPTGAGKTWIFCQYLYKNSDKALIICPSLELQEQILNTCKQFNINASKNIHDKKKNHVITSLCLSYQNTLYKLYQNNYDHIVFDEAHHAQSPIYINFIKGLHNDPKILGCTATPERLDKKPLLEIFGILSYQKNILEMIESGYLADIKAYKIKSQQKISIKNTDFRVIDLKILDNQSRNEIIIKSFMNNCSHLKTLIFCLNISHAKKISDMLQEQGIKSAYVYGSMDKKIRKEILMKFKSGEIQVLTNCQVLTEGFDEPSIECLIITRPTASKSLYCQMIGRGLRKTEKKDTCILYEITDNNFKICTFNVTCDLPPQYQNDYIPGIRLSELGKKLEKVKKDLETIPITDIILDKEPIKLFANKNKLPGNPVNLLTSKFYNYHMTSHQKLLMDSCKIKCYPLTGFLEAAFLIWKHELEKKHGINTKNKK